MIYHSFKQLAHIPIYDGNLRLKIQCKNIITKLRESIFTFLNYRMLLNCRTGRLATPHLRPRATAARPPLLAPFIVRSVFSKSIWHRTLKLDVIYHLIELNNPSDFGLCSSIRTEIKSGTRLDASSDHNSFPYMHSRQWDESDDVSLLAVGWLFFKLLGNKGFAQNPL